MKRRKIPYQQIAVNPGMMTPRKSKGIVNISENTKSVSEIIKYLTEHLDTPEP